MRLFYKSVVCVVMTVWAAAGVSAQKSAPSAQPEARDTSAMAAPRQTPVSPYRSPAAPGYYIWPMDLPKLLSANFGELRPNHFHAGIDIKTAGSEGHAVRAAADGYVSRVAVSPGGYGRAVYVAHPNGTTTVYAHLLRFFPALEKHVVDEMYRLQRPRVDLSFTPDRFPVKQGMEIAKSGNTGGSFGPHLHFEVRESADQTPVNILALGLYGVTDRLPPTLLNLYWFEVDTVRGVPVCAPPKRFPLRKTEDGYVTDGTVGIGRQGYFAIEATDRKNDTHNTMGVYRIAALLDGVPFFELRNDRVSFADTRYVNSVSVYPMQRGSRTEIFRLAVQAGNRAPLYYGVRNRGAVAPADTLPHRVGIDVTDDSGNVSRVSFDMQASGSVEPSTSVGGSAEPVAFHDRPFTHERNGVRVVIPAGALYEPVFYRQEFDSTLADYMARMGSSEKPGTKRPVAPLSPLHTIHAVDVPLHQSITIGIPVDIPPALRGRAALARVERDGSMSYAGGTWSPGRVSGKVRSFGTYCAVVDTVPPKITPSFTPGADLRGAEGISFAVADDFSGIGTYELRIDGQWALPEYDPMRRRIRHRFSTFRFSKSGTHTVRLEVADDKGNRSVWEGTFVR